MIVDESYKEFFGYTTEEELLDWAVSEFRNEAGVTVYDRDEVRYEVWGVCGGGGCCEECWEDFARIALTYDGATLTYEGTFAFARGSEIYLKDTRLVTED